MAIFERSYIFCTTSNWVSSFTFLGRRINGCWKHMWINWYIYHMVVLLIIKKATTRPFLHHLDCFPLDFAPLMGFVDLRFCFAFFFGKPFFGRKIRDSDRLVSWSFVLLRLRVLAKFAKHIADAMVIFVRRWTSVKLCVPGSKLLIFLCMNVCIIFIYIHIYIHICKYVYYHTYIYIYIYLGMVILAVGRESWVHGYIKLKKRPYCWVHDLGAVPSDYQERWLHYEESSPLLIGFSDFPLDGIFVTFFFWDFPIGFCLGKNG